MIIDSRDPPLEDHRGNGAAVVPDAEIQARGLLRNTCMFPMSESRRALVSRSHSNARRVFSLGRSILKIVRIEAKWITECFPKSISVAVWQQCMGSAIYHNINTHQVKASNKKA